MGGTQFNGLAAVRKLVADGHKVTICNRGQTKVDLPGGVDRLQCDRTDTDRMHEVLGGREYDVIYDLTAYHQGDASLMFDIFNGSVGHYICASSTVIYAASEHLPITEDMSLEDGAPQIEYGTGKVDIERYLDARVAEGFPATIAAFSMVYGPRNIIPDREQRMYRRLLEGRPVMIPGDGTTLLQVTFVDDQADALVSLGGRSDAVGERYNLTSPRVVTDIGYVQTIADVLGVEPDLRFVPHEVMERLWDGDLELDLGQNTRQNIDIRSSDKGKKQRAGSALRARFKFSTVMQRLAPNIHRWNRSVFFSSEKLHALTGWTAAHDLAAMTEHTWDWYQSVGLAESQEFDWTFEEQLLAHTN